jgi:hypothetical protein
MIPRRYCTSTLAGNIAAPSSTLELQHDRRSENVYTIQNFRILSSPATPGQARPLSKTANVLLIPERLLACITLYLFTISSDNYVLLHISDNYVLLHISVNNTWTTNVTASGVILTFSETSRTCDTGSARWECTNFSNIRWIRLKILDARRATWWKFHTKDPQISRVEVQNLVATATWRPESAYPMQQLSRTISRRRQLWKSKVSVSGARSNSTSQAHVLKLSNQASKCTCSSFVTSVQLTTQHRKGDCHLC